VADRDFRGQFDEAEWDALLSSSVPVCHDASSAAADDSVRWSNLACLLAQVGMRAAGVEGERDLALRVLADFRR